ncbi:MAG: deoxyribose-phosphate aldolase [Phycisphaerales bacterium]|nr:MAG: deoxyribose-phosphate aldolase [Phycisphaerales bacterium]
MLNDKHQLSSEKLASYIDHTLLEATATRERVERVCREAMDYGFHTVCVNGRWLPLVAELLAGSKVAVGGVVSLPLGANSTKVKIAQARDAIFAGADEIDMVADLAAIIEGDSRYLLSQLLAVLKVCRSMRPAVLLKVIIESAALSDEQKVFACRIAQQTGVDFVKTSTGLHPAGGATIDDIRLLRESAPGCKVKAAGGIKTAEQAVEMIAAGAQRIGTSSGVQIMEEFKAR